VGHRVITGLEWAKLLKSRPKAIPVGRPRGAKAKGIHYERELAKLLPGASAGRWFEFEDRNGHGHCQPDFVLSFASELVVLECKLTWVPAGHTQIEQLYQPVLESLSAKRVLGVVVCKNLLPDMPVPVFGDLASAIAGARNGRAVWHWLGVGGIGEIAQAA